jgi:hypothetical protein
MPLCSDVSQRMVETGVLSAQKGSNSLPKIKFGDNRHKEDVKRIKVAAKDLHYHGRTPVIFASRSPHMEDIGALRHLCANKAERLEVKNLTPQIALELAQREAERIELWASNLEAILPLLVEWSDGNPGAILHMLKMAQLPQYRAGDQIKSHILYVDFCMGRR